MRVRLVCVGGLHRHFESVAEHYLSLLRPYARVEVVEVAEVPLSRGEREVLEKEARAVLRHVRKDAFTVALDARGRQLTSKGFSSLLSRRKVHGWSDFEFIVGGALGLSSEVVDAADFVWSLSGLTFPHQLARCLLLEQLYRAVKIERGEPYHH